MSADARRRILGRRPTAPAVATAVRRTRPSAVPTNTDARIESINDGAELVMDLLKSGRPNMKHFRAGGMTHVSDVISKCVRQIALNRRMQTTHAPAKIPDGHALTFAQGDAIHDFIKTKFMEGHPDKVWAKWGCACGETTVGPMLYSKVGPALACKKCGTVPKRYIEFAIEDREHELVGSPDLLLYLQEVSAYYLVEVKSMTAKMWDELERPQPDHVVQSMFYWKLMRDRPMPVVDQFSILYVKKEYSFKWPYKEFAINAPKSMKVLDPFLGDLQALALARDPKAPLPPRIVCASPTAPEAKKCNVCVTCFQLDSVPGKRSR